MAKTLKKTKDGYEYIEDTVSEEAVSKSKTAATAPSVNSKSATATGTDVNVPVSSTSLALSSNKPSYTSPYSQYSNEVLKKILDREEFKYSPQTDKMYQYYADNYKKLGQQAMQDTVGNAALLTGGYGNSYGVTAGQQAYNRYMQDLANVVPQLEQQAYNRYQADTNDLYNRYQALMQAENEAYSKYRDTVSDYYNNRNFEYSQQQDALAQQNWQKNFDRSVYESDRSYEYKKAQDAMDKIYSSMAENGGKFEVSDVAKFIKDYRDVYNSEEEFVYALATQFDDFGDDFYDYLGTIKSENGGTWLDIIMGGAGEMKDFLGDMSDNRGKYIPDSKANAEREKLILKQQILKDAEKLPDGEIRNSFIRAKYKEYGLI